MADSENPGGSSSRNGSSSKRAVVSSSRTPSFSCEPIDQQLARASRVISDISARPAAAAAAAAPRIPPSALESAPKVLPRHTVGRSSRDDALKALEFLSIAAEKRK